MMMIITMIAMLVNVNDNKIIVMLMMMIIYETEKYNCINIFIHGNLKCLNCKILRVFIFLSSQHKIQPMHLRNICRDLIHISIF